MAEAARGRFSRDDAEPQRCSFGEPDDISLLPLPLLPLVLPLLRAGVAAGAAAAGAAAA
jgi:hypothetical protein